jgi:flagellar motor switch protein FliG
MPSSDIRKAAVLLVSLPADEAARIMATLDPSQVEAVSLEIAKLGTISFEEQEAVIRDFAAANPARLGGETGGLARAKELMEKALGGEASTRFDNVRQQVEALPFGFLSKVDSENLLTFIMDEHPQTIALILSYMPPKQSAAILSGLPSDRQLAVIRRIAHMGQTNPEVVAEVERGLESRMSSVMRQKFAAAGGVETVASLLNVIDRPVERNIMESLAQGDPDLVEEIRRRMFVFTDIVKLSDKDVQNVLKQVEAKQWAMALKGVPEEVKQKVLGNMSSRAAQLLKDEMDLMGPVRASDVDQMQQQIVEIIRRLEDAGEITVVGDEGAEELIA